MKLIKYVYQGFIYIIKKYIKKFEWYENEKYLNLLYFLIFLTKIILVSLLIRICLEPFYKIKFY